MTIEEPKGRIALWQAKEGARYAMSGRLTIPTEMLTELVQIAGDIRSEVVVPIFLWDNSSSSKPGAPSLSGYANLPPALADQIKPKTSKATPKPVQRQGDWGELPF